MCTACISTEEKKKEDWKDRITVKSKKLPRKHTCSDVIDLPITWSTQKGYLRIRHWSTHGSPAHRSRRRAR